MLTKIRALGAVMCGVVLMAAAGCSGPSEAEGTTEQGTGTRHAGRSDSGNGGAPGRTDLPPADYVRYRCDQCSCTVFNGDGADCSRPGCRHHWSNHVRTFK